MNCSECDCYSKTKEGNVKCTKYVTQMDETCLLRHMLWNVTTMRKWVKSMNESYSKNMSWFNKMKNKLTKQMDSFDEGEEWKGE